MGPLWCSQRLYCLGSVGVRRLSLSQHLRRSGWSFFVAFRVFVDVFMGHWGGTLVVFTALVMFMGLWG